MRIAKSGAFVDTERVLHAAIFDALPDPALLVRDGVVQAANAAFVRGFAGEQPIGRTLISLAPGCPPELLSRLAQLPERGLAGEAYVSRVVFELASTGGRLALEMRVVGVDDEGWLLIGQDATDAADLRETIGLLSRLYVKHRSAAMVDVDVLLTEARPIFEGLGWNLALWSIEHEGEVPGARLRYSLTVGQDASQLRSTTDVVQALQDRFVPLRLLEHLRRVVEDRRGVLIDDMASVGGELMRELDGDATITQRLRAAGIARAALAPVFVDEQVASVLMFSGARITERDFAAIQLFAAMFSAAEQIGGLSEEMARQERHAALGQMAAQLAHEVRNPLAVLYQATAQIRRRTREGRDITELVAIIDEESRRLDRLVNDLVHFAAPLAPRVRETSLEPIVRYALDGVRAELGEAAFDSLQVHVDIGELVVLADAALLRQALAHLFHNAIGHSQKGGTVEVRAWRDGASVRLRVRNDGAPLAPDVASRVFEPFFSTKAQGSGLGLAVVRRLVEDQGGCVLLEPHETGVSFAVTLPSA